MLHRMLSPKFNNPGGITEDFLRTCLQYLKKNQYHFLSLEEMVQALTTNRQLPKRSVVFTIDDGYIDQAEIALPVFEEFNCPVTFFVITGMLDQTLWPWDAQVAWITQATKKESLNINISGNAVRFQLNDVHNKRLSRRAIQDYFKSVDSNQLPEQINSLAEAAAVDIPAHPPAEFMPMTWTLARQYESDIVRFAPHSITHNILSKLDAESLEKELHGSWLKISSELDQPAKIFCYPTGRPGDYGTREIEALNRLGYTAAVSTTAATVDIDNHSSQQLFTLPRYALPSTMGDFIQYCSWIEFARNRK